MSPDLQKTEDVCQPTQADPAVPAEGSGQVPASEFHQEAKVGRLVHRGILRDLLVVAGLLVARMNWVLLTIGLSVFVMGAVLHFWSKSCLMRNFMVTRHGPYRFVRHPFYLANLVIDLGICLIAGNLYLPVVYLPLFLLAYIPTIRQEERDLTAAHGEAYREFTRQIPMLIPLRLDRVWGPWDGSWTNIWRENEITRLGRILAIPLYFLLADTLFHHRLTGEFSWTVALPAAASAIVINVVAAKAKRWSRHRLMDLSDLSEIGAEF